ncbi:MAG: glycosyltransferase family 2 protein [Prevotella sp.]|nr:glycosyltransferase family 2 protein [Prevotella sp.]
MSIVNTPPRLVIVVPCYNEEAVLTETNTRLTGLLKDLTAKSKIMKESFVAYVDDGSKDTTWQLILKLQQGSEQVHGLKLAHNAGHQNALMAGMETFKDRADAIVTIDADLQDDVNAIVAMVDAYLEGTDIVYGVRRERTTDTFFKRTTALFFYRLMAVLGADTVYNHADYRLMSRRAVDELCQYSERNLFLRGLVPLLGYPVKKVYYDRAERFAGESKYPFGKMLSFAIDGITSFSVKPISVIFLSGIICLLIGLGMLGWVFYSYIVDRVVQGWTSLMVSLWLIGGIVIISLGVIGNYIGKIYIEVKHRPRYHIEMEA